MSRLLLAALVTLSIGVNSARLVVEPESSSDKDARADVISVLSAESECRQPFDRRALLQDVLRENPDAAPVRWHAGDVRVAGEWRSVDDGIDTIRDDALRETYWTLRDAAGQNDDDQVRVANWCKANGLPQQERAHLTAALAFSGERDLPAVRARLGQQLVGGRWMTQEEAAEAERSSREMFQSMKTWGNRLQNIGKRLAGNRRQRDSAVLDLKAIDDPSALPAIELVLAPAHEFAGLQAVEWFARNDRYQTSLALARQAAFSDWAQVRSSATDVLKSRRWEDFIPPLLTTMHRPAESMFQILIGGRGEVYYTHLCAREMNDHWQVARYSMTSFASRLSGRFGPNSFRRRQIVAPEPILVPSRSARRRNDAVRLAHDDFHARERMIVGRNQQSERFNARIGTLLADITGRPFTSSPDEWWNWWVARIDVEARPKRVVIVDEQERFILPPRDAPVRYPRVQAMSCFVAGTPIWTDSGHRPIEDIRIGDRVLAKNVETGELAYKPVVLTTKRQAPHIVRLSVGRESFEVTGGHLVWASGSGWTKARDLTATQLLHTVTGTVAVNPVEAVGSGTVYNLVIADFHTYFFGDAKILSHDTTIPKLTNVLVPGLPPEHSHAE